MRAGPMGDRVKPPHRGSKFLWGGGGRRRGGRGNFFFGGVSSLLRD